MRRKKKKKLRKEVISALEAGDWKYRFTKYKNMSMNKWCSDDFIREYQIVVDKSANLQVRHDYTDDYIAYFETTFTGIILKHIDKILYIKDGKWHREDGPANIRDDGLRGIVVAYYLFGEEVTEEAHALYVDLMKLKKIVK